MWQTKSKQIYKTFPELFKFRNRFLIYAEIFSPENMYISWLSYFFVSLRFWMRLSKLKSRNLLPSRGVCMTNVGCMLALIMYLAWLIWRRVRIQFLRTVHKYHYLVKGTWGKSWGKTFFLSLITTATTTPSTTTSI